MSQSAPAIPPFADTPVVPAGPARVVKTSTRQWLLHSFLFFLTAVTTTIAGIYLAAPADIYTYEPPLVTLLDYVLFIPLLYLGFIKDLLSFAFTNFGVLGEGLIFSISLLAILFSHEMGHYLACRYYGVNATLPFFIPAPPLFLAGTFGAFIKIKSPIPSRRALIDIGLAGPLAGFVVAIPLAIVGVLQSAASTATIPEGPAIIFNDPPMFRLIGWVAGLTLDPFAPINPYWMAAWIGLLVTALNLMPVGQLDGGHGTFAVFGPRAHRLIGRLAFISMAVVAVLGYIWHGSPSGFLYTVLLGVMLRVRHPQPQIMEPLGVGRTVMAIVTLIVFLLCFWPFPLTLI